MAEVGAESDAAAKAVSPGCKNLLKIKTKNMHGIAKMLAYTESCSALVDQKGKLLTSVDLRMILYWYLLLPPLIDSLRCPKTAILRMFSRMIEMLIGPYFSSIPK